ncbi:DUF294 nucleotidyltransferase-like domain-containing protein [Psychrobacillus sp. FSL K6-2684]|uniref:DUF294 nucleotidyltransferase-like domain-containing protein n=1 Tax=unclassified Psychrobacillus TaxID=2636677 RepID=UPI0012489C35|nr:DUF294 nucleotidyltransferase-like domain-containing protein [Psychrobacillus sp. AK 1817]QEY20233.1 hypothetical protein D0S48_05775 [Psychrobacillus sp. AK 1817]
METYESIREWKDRQIMSYLKDTISLNVFHDQVMHKVMDVAKTTAGIPPCDFTWFITGSGGRKEQGLISDQDHGIVYEWSSEKNDAYFKTLGDELALGLNAVGYPYCKGNVMSSNPMWCKSFEQWQEQLGEWLSDEGWEAIRYLQIFFDARALYGNQSYTQQLKSIICEFIRQHPSTLPRFSSNIKHIKNVIGPVGQILVERHGPYQGNVNFKYAAFLPYVNAVRLLSIKEGVLETSTLKRINQLTRLNDYKKMLQNCEKNFIELLIYRMILLQKENYEDTHYLNINNLNKEQLQNMKRILKDGKRLHSEVIELTSIS